MIRAVIVINDEDEPRLLKFYDCQQVKKQQELIRTIYAVLCGRAENVRNFIQADSTFGPPWKPWGTRRHLTAGYDLAKGKWKQDAFRLTVVWYEKLGSLDTNGARLVYKTYATLYFIFIFDSSKNERAILDLMQVFVETMDKCFSNVCELDIVFNFNKVHTIFDEIILGGQVLETSSSKVLGAVEEHSKLEKGSNTIKLVPKSIPGWQGR